MTPERWQKVKDLFQAALEQPTERRDAFLVQACAGDEALRQEVEALMTSHEQASRFMEAAALEAAEILTANPEGSLEGQHSGPYQVLRTIGQGGMGTVYLAVRADDQYRKQVAIKLVRQGMNTDFTRRRFRHERQILAGLDHPNIARLLDGGTTKEGLPYLVMEHIEGQPIDQYCDERRLNTAERLRLFRTVCAAVHYAHQSLIVHRDIKPSNILVTAEGVPKLLDFGIAKLLNPELSDRTAEPTVTGMQMMTPEYAGPEQVRGESVTTASDVYSLGVLLYEVLSGHRPYRLKSRTGPEILRAICEEEPERPSTAIRRIEPAPKTTGRPPDTLTPESVSRTREGQPEKL